MSLPGKSALRCAQCQKPFGFVVAFCPFCGVSQQQAPSRHAPAAPAVLPPLPSKPAALADVQPAGAGPWQAASVAKARAARKSATAGGKQPPTGLRWATAILVLAAVGSVLLVRHNPMGTLVVLVAPAAAGAVIVDGQPAGRPGESLRLRAGPHSVGFDAEGWVATARQVTLQDNRQQSVTLELTPQPAVLLLSRDPADAVLRLDGRVIDAGQAEVPVPPGRHHLSARRAGHLPFEQDLTLERGERRAVRVALTPVVVRVLPLQAPVGSWSEPVALPPRTGFTLALSGRVRLRVGQEVFLVGPGGSMNLGEVHAPSLQLKAVDSQPVEVRMFLKPEG